MRNVLMMMTAVAAMTAAAEFTVDKSVMSDEYWKIWNDEEMSQINADIEKYRKADAVVELDVPDGAEVSVKQVSDQFYFGAHIFNFNQLGKKEYNDRYKALYDSVHGLFNSGTVAFYWKTFEPYPNAPRFAERHEDTENFWNNCPNPKHQAHWRRPAPDPVIAHLRRGGCRIHGHPLVWGNNEWMTPEWIWEEFTPESEKVALQRRCSVEIPKRDFTKPIGVKDGNYCWKWADAWQKVYKTLSEAEIAAIVPSFVKAQQYFMEKRIREIGERYGQIVDSWDVVNESATDWAIGAKREWPKASFWANCWSLVTGGEWAQDESSAWNRLPVTKSHYGLLPPNYAYQAITLSRQAMRPSAHLNVNEYNMSAFPGQIADLEAHGADFDVVGSQMHLFNPKESLKIAEGKGPTHLTPKGIRARFESVGKVAGKRPIHLSEITITAPDLTPKGQMIQAIIASNCYRAWFAVEKMNGITWWNVVDDCGAPGEPSISGMFTRDMQPKTVYHAMEDLFHREFRTVTTVKAKGGKVAFRGFRGRYHLRWTNAKGESCYRSIDVK